MDDQLDRALDRAEIILRKVLRVVCLLILAFFVINAVTEVGRALYPHLFGYGVTEANILRAILYVLIIQVLIGIVRPSK